MAEARKPKPASFLPAAIFSDVHDLVLKNKQIGRTFTGQPHHVLVVVFNPAAHRLPVHQLQADRLQEAGFFKGLFRRRRPPALAGIGVSLRTERHAGIVHKARGLGSRLPANRNQLRTAVAELQCPEEFLPSRSGGPP